MTSTISKLLQKSKRERGFSSPAKRNPFTFPQIYTPNPSTTSTSRHQGWNPYRSSRGKKPRLPQLNASDKRRKPVPKTLERNQSPPPPALQARWPLFGSRRECRARPCGRFLNWLQVGEAAARNQDRIKQARPTPRG